MTIITDISSRTGSCFDACAVGSYLLRAYADTVSVSTVSEISEIHIERLPDETLADCAWEVLTTQCVNIDTTVPLSVASDGAAEVRVFFYSNDGKIQYVECADATRLWGVSFGAPQDVGSVSDVEFLAATSTTKVHYITKNSNNNRRLHYYEHDGAWASTDSDIYWPFPIYAMDAITHGGLDLIVLATQMAPLLGSRAIGTTVTVEANEVQGIVTFRETAGRWSDHDQFDVIDIIDVALSRDEVRISYYGGVLFATYLRCGGQDSYTYSKAVASRSKDGVSWEFPEIFEDITPPFLILPRSDYLYAVGINKTQRSPCCAWAGQTPVELDVTQYTAGLGSQAAEIRSTQLEMANVADVLSGTLAKSTDRCQAVYKLGYVTGGSALRMTVGTEDVIEWEDQRGTPRRAVATTTRDRLGRLNRTVSDFAAEWPSMQAGRDAYDDPAGTGYGGLRHTAPYEGSWKASGGECNLISLNMEGLAVSTFVSGALNGSIRTGFELNYTDKGEYAGVAFRIFDKDNFLFVAYYADDDKVRMKSKEGSMVTTLATSAAMGWTIDGTNRYYLMVRTHYSMVYVYYSTDGVTWSELSWASGSGELYGIDSMSTDYMSVWSGKFGLIGYCYSDADSWPDWTPSPWPTPAIPRDYGMLVLCKDQLARSANFFDLDDTAHWEDISSGLSGTFYCVAVGPSGQGWATTSDGLFYIADVSAATIDWACIKTVAAARAESGLAAGDLRSLDIAGTGHVYANLNHWNYTQAGYFYGSAGGVAYHQFPDIGACHFRTPTTRCLFSVYLAGSTPYISGGSLSCAYARVWSNDVYTEFLEDPTEQTAMSVHGNFTQLWNGQIYNGSSRIYTETDSPFGIHSLGGQVLYRKGSNRYLYRDGDLLADALPVFNDDASCMGARAIFVYNDPSRIVWAVASEAGPAKVARFIVYSPDAFINWYDRSGDFYTEIANWSGESAPSGFGNAMCTPYVLP